MNSASELTKSALRQDLDLWRLPGQELHDVLDVLRRQAPVVPVTFLGMPCWLITDHETLVTAFRDNDDFPPHTPYKFGIEPVIGETFQTMEGDRHRFFRKLATPTFMPRSVDRIDSTMLVDVADELIDTFIKKNEVDLVSAFTRRYPFTVIARLLGIPREEEEQFHHWATTILSFRSNPKESFKSRDEFWAYLDPVIAERRQNPQDDVISHLIHDELAGVRMTDDQIKSHIGIMFTAGSSTTHDSLGNLIYALLSTDDDWQRVKMDTSLRQKAIEETLRWEPAVSILPRMSAAGRTTTLGGVEMVADSFVLFAISAANHDASIFENPHEFDLDRNTEAMMTFGPGPRMCPGMHLARKELAMTLNILIERLPNLTLLDAEKSKPCGTIFRSPEQLVCRY